MRFWEFDRWVNDNSIPSSFEYGKGWWDYVELVRRFASRLNAHEVSVIGHYVVETPPPTEQLPMPAVAIRTDGVTFALRHDFGSYSMRSGLKEWAVSVDRRSPYGGHWFGLIDETQDLRTDRLDGLAPDHLFGPFREDTSRFLVLVRDEWEVAMLMRMMAHEP